MLLKRTLGYLGLLPFVISLLFVNQTVLGSIVYGWQSFIVYSIAIASFLSGTYWQPNKDCKKTSIISNVLCVLAFIAFFLSPVGSATLLAILFFFLWRFERLLTQSQALTRTKEYLAMRSQLTLAVILLHVIFILVMLADK